MANINLTTGEDRGGSVLSLNHGNLILFGIVILALLAYGALIFLKKDFDKKLESKKNEFNADLLLFSEDNAKNVADFQNRLDMSRNLLKTGQNNIDYLIRLERAIISGVVVQSYSFNSETNSITLNCMADNYEILAKQILNLKTKNEFASVFAGKSSFSGEQGKIMVEIVLKNK